MTTIYKIYQFCIAAPLIILATGITATIMAVGSTLFSAHFWGYWPGVMWAKFVCRILLLPVNTSGHELLDKNTSYVFVANHQGAFDIFLLYGYLGRNFKWMMKKELRRAPMIGKACESAGHIFVDKSGPKAIQNTVEQGRRVLRGGTSLVIFPEGARSYTGHMSTFRKGAFMLADELQMPVVPITIDGSFDILPRMKGINFVNRRPLNMTIHKPIYPIGQGEENMKHICQESYDAIMSGLPEEYRN